MTGEGAGSDGKAAREARLRGVLIGLAAMHAAAIGAAYVVARPLAERAYAGGSETLWLCAIVGLCAWVGLAGAFAIGGRRLGAFGAIVVVSVAWVGAGLVTPPLSRWYQQRIEGAAWQVAQEATTMAELEAAYAHVPPHFWREQYGAKMRELEVAAAVASGDVRVLRELAGRGSGGAAVVDALRTAYRKAADGLARKQVIDGDAHVDVDADWRSGWVALLEGLASAGPRLSVVFRVDASLATPAGANETLRRLVRGDADARADPRPPSAWAIAAGDAFTPAEREWREQAFVAGLGRALQAALGPGVVAPVRATDEGSGWRLVVELDLRRGPGWTGVRGRGGLRGFVFELRTVWSARLVAPDGTQVAALPARPVVGDDAPRVTDERRDPTWAPYVVLVHAAGDRFRRRLLALAGVDPGPPPAAYRYR